MGKPITFSHPVSMRILAKMNGRSPCVSIVVASIFKENIADVIDYIDLYTRECRGIWGVQIMRSTEVAQMLNSIALRRPLPQLLKTGNGSEFLMGKCWTGGCMKEAARSTSHAREHRRTTLWWGPSTVG